jgi:subtilisin family serine protease
VLILVLGALVLAASPATSQVPSVTPPVKAHESHSPAVADKVEAGLRSLMATFRTEGITVGNAAALGASERFSSPTLKVDGAGRVQVYVYVAYTDPATLAVLVQQGVEVEIVNDHFRIVQGWIPVESLDALAAEAVVLRIRLPSYGLTQSGSVTTQGDGIHRCDQVRSSTGLTGAGIKVGVISDGVNGLVAAQSSGNLPASVQVLSTQPGDEGTAMLEIVHDCAPGAALAFASGVPSSLAFIQAVDALRQAGATVIVDDLGFFTQPYFADGELAQHDRTIGNAVLRISAAGNGAQEHYQGFFTPWVSNPAFHDFGGSDPLLHIRLPPQRLASIVLQWANPFDAAVDDYDFCVRDSLGFVIVCGDDPQNGNDQPLEAKGVFCPNVFSECIFTVEIRLFSGVPRVLELFTLGATLAEHLSPGDSVFGHQAAPEVLAVAAVGASAPSSIQPYSSHGPSTVLFPTPQTRSKPDITGVDCVATSRPAPFANFCGTSAAAPHVAAIAALVLQRNPTLSPAQVREILRSSAIDLGPAGFDHVFGAGRADALNAVNATPLPAPPERRLTVTLAGSGGGTVLSQPGGIVCGVDCTEVYTHGTTVTLTAIPAAASVVFSGWQGGGCSGLGPCIVTLTADTAVTATFSVLERRLTVTLAGAGSGAVVSQPIGIACGVDCTEIYPQGTAVTLSVSPAVGSVFSGWQGGGCSGLVQCLVTLTTDTTVIATFSPLAPMIEMPQDGAHVPLLGPTPVTFAWPSVAGAVRYLFEYSHPNRVFANPNGVTLDPINGAGSLQVTTPGFLVVLDPAFPYGLYAVRVMALTAAGSPIGVFSNALTLVLGIPSTAQPTITAPLAGSLLYRGMLTEFSWTAVPGAAQYRFDYRGPGGFTGSFAVSGPGFTAVIPADIPAGTYQVTITALGGSGTLGGVPSGPHMLLVSLGGPPRPP